MEDTAHRTPSRPSTSCLGEYWEFADAKKKGNKANQEQATGYTKEKRPIGEIWGSLPSR